MATTQNDELTKLFEDADAGREYIESVRWADGVTCPHCSVKEAYKLTATEGAKSPIRKGVYKCKACRKQFTVTVGTIFEGSHIPLNKWIYAIYLMCNSNEGVNAHQLHFALNITYKSARFMCQRLRYAIQQALLDEKLTTIAKKQVA
jgi:transposase-like protein